MKNQSLKQRPLAPHPRQSRGAKQDSAAMHHPHDEWMAMYPYIQRLYEVEGYKLRELKSRMELEHGFKATDMMYKKRFTQWGLTKSRHIKRKASSSPKPDSVEQSQNKVLHMKRFPFEGRTSALGRETQQTTTGLICRPSMTPSEKALAEVIASIRHWSLAVLPGCHSRPDRQCVSSKAGVRSSSTLLYQTFMLAMDLLSRGYGVLAGKAVRKAFILLEDATSDQTPVLMWNLIDLMLEMSLQGQGKLLRAFITHLTALTNWRDPRNHPIMQLATRLRYIDEISSGWETSILSAASKCSFDCIYDHVLSNFLPCEEGLLWECCLSRVGPCMTPSDDPLVLTSWMTHTQAEGNAASKAVKSALEALFSAQTSIASIPGEITVAVQNGGDLLGAVVERRGRAADARKLLAKVVSSSGGRQTFEEAAISRNEDGRSCPRDVWEMWYLAKQFDAVGIVVEARKCDMTAMRRAENYLADIA